MNWLDLKLGGRMLVKYPGLTMVGSLAMAFAIWVGIVIVQVVGLFVHPTLPLPEGARLVEIRSMDGTAIIFTVASLIKYTEFPGSESDLTLQGMAMIIGYGIVMLGVCMLGCVVPTRRALNIEPTIALRTE
jgi:ABC-type antimicrobial peptide transport system permease subunit